jgi:SAM-dependent methyltransferase
VVGSPLAEKRYHSIVEHYEACLERHGDTHLGVDWPKAEDVETRHRVMLDVIRRRDGNPVRVLDFGCGASHLYEYIRSQGVSGIEYSGLDISPRFVELSQSKFPEVRYWCADILDDDVLLPQFDYAVMNGLFTERVGMTFEDMFEYFKQVIRRVFQLVDDGLVFNVMSKQVDWERDDLFHLPFDVLAGFLTSEISRNFVLRHDYGLYEYTTYVYR